MNHSNARQCRDARRAECGRHEHPAANQRGMHALRCVTGQADDGDDLLGERRVVEVEHRRKSSDVARADAELIGRREAPLTTHEVDVDRQDRLVAGEGSNRDNGVPDPQGAAGSIEMDRVALGYVHD